MYSIQDHFPVYSVFLLILIIAGNNLFDLFSCKIRKLFERSLLLNHLVAYLTLVFFIIITIPVRDKHILKIIPRSTVLYAFFLGLIKTLFPYFVAILAIIMVIYVLVLYKSELQDSIDTLRAHSSSQNSQSPKPTTTNTIIDVNQEIQQINSRIDTIVLTNNVLTAIMIPLYIIGFVLYIRLKKEQYKDSFRFFTFLFGKVNCKKKLISS
jgi:hypothetical protein